MTAMPPFPAPLLRALRKGDAASFSRQLARFGDLEQRDAQGATLLHRACERPKATPCVAELLDRGAAIEASDPWKRTPLLRAAALKAKATVALLLDRGAVPDPRDGLHRSTIEALPDLELLDLLLARGARMEPPLASEGLLACAWHDCPATIERLVGLGADLHVRHRIGGTTPLVTAAELLRAQNVRALLRLGADVNLPAGGGMTALIAAVTSRFTKPDSDVAGTVGALLEAGADRSPRHKGSQSGPDIPRTALEHARALGRPEPAKLLDDGRGEPPGRALALGMWRIRIVNRRDLEIACFPNDPQATLMISGGGEGPGDPGWTFYGTPAEALTKHGDTIRREAAWFVPFVEALARGEAVDIDDLVRLAGGFSRFGES
jgi:hypothetical protein